jgi:hypothetical protein
LNLEVGRRQLKPEMSRSTATIELDSLSFLMDTSYSKEEPKIQEDVAGRKEVKEEESGRRKKWKLKHRQHKMLTLGLDQITKFVYRLDGPLGEGNV